MPMGHCLDASQRDGTFDFNTCVVSTGPAADRQAGCLAL
jgi:hypothetical protein